MTYRTIGLDIDDAVYQQAVERALRENKTINRVMVDLLAGYAAQSKPVEPSPAPITPSQPEPPAEPAPPPTPPVSPPTVETKYTIQSGDTLGAIARKFYGSANKYFIIQNANNLSDPGKIWVGQVLTIPPLDSPTPPSSPPTPPSPPVTTNFTNQPRPPIRFVGSPNFNRRPRGEISAIVMHATANGNLERVIDWFNNPDAQVSAHYTIGKDGAIVQHVRDEHRAWHAGISEWQGRKDLNSWAIGIELVNWNNNEDPYSEAQHQAAVNLAAYLAARYKINPDLIVAHYDVSPRRKTDPRGYDMARLRREVSARI